MEEKTSELETLISRTEEYAKTSFEIIKLKTLDKSAEVASSLITTILYTIMMSICLIVLSLGVSYWVGEMLDKIYLGFIIVGAFWAITVIFLFFVFNKRIKKLLGDSIIKKALKTS